MAIKMDRTTFLLACARFTSAVARLSLGPLLPILTASIGFSNDSKSSLLSAYASGYILTQIGGGFLADKYGARAVVSAGMAISSVILLILLVYSENGNNNNNNNNAAVIWTQAYFALGLVAGPLYPAGSAAISGGVPKERRAGAAAIVDASAAAGTCAASLSPMIVAAFGWRGFLFVTALGLAAVAIGSTGLKERKKVLPLKQSTVESDLAASKYSIAALLSNASICTYACHSAENFSKYSVNAWTATMLSERHHASTSLVGTILGTQEAVGVVSRVLFGINDFGSSSPALRGSLSALAFAVQGACLSAAYKAPTHEVVAICLVVFALAAGAHSIGFRPMYFEASPDHVGSVSGVGNTIASFASAAGPICIGAIVSSGDPSNEKMDNVNVVQWDSVGLLMGAVNLAGAVAAVALTQVGRRRKTEDERNRAKVRNV